jgi:hypothetical protein
MNKFELKKNISRSRRIWGKEIDWKRSLVLVLVLILIIILWLNPHMFGKKKNFFLLRIRKRKKRKVFNWNMKSD